MWNIGAWFMDIANAVVSRFQDASTTTRIEKPDWQLDLNAL